MSPESLSQSFYPGIRNLHTKGIDCYRSVSICIDLLETELNAISLLPSKRGGSRSNSSSSGLGSLYSDSSVCDRNCEAVLVEYGRVLAEVR